MGNRNWKSLADTMSYDTEVYDLLKFEEDFCASAPESILLTKIIAEERRSVLQFLGIYTHIGILAETLGRIFTECGESEIKVEYSDPELTFHGDNSEGYRVVFTCERMDINPLSTRPDDAWTFERLEQRPFVIGSKNVSRFISKLAEMEADGCSKARSVKFGIGAGAAIIILREGDQYSIKIHSKYDAMMEDRK
jgi:hypothetical protein